MRRNQYITTRIHRIKMAISHFRRAISALNLIDQKLTHWQIEKLRTSARYKSEKNLIPYGYKIYSQDDEDGIIREIFTRIGTTNKIFVEFGIGNGTENNSFALMCHFSQS